MPYAQKIQVLRSGPALAPLLENDEALHWSLCATGQAFSSEPLPPPAVVNDLNLVEPLGGNLLHLILRPSLKQLDQESDITFSPSQTQLSMAEILLSRTAPGSDEWSEILKSRDLFGLRAVDYISNKVVLRGLPLEQSVSDEFAKPSKFRGIILSLTSSEMLKSDLFYNLLKARDAAGIDLFPGINTRNTKELRAVLLRYFDLLNRALNQTGK